MKKKEFRDDGCVEMLKSLGKTSISGNLTLDNNEAVRYLKMP